MDRSTYRERLSGTVDDALRAVVTDPAGDGPAVERSDEGRIVLGRALSDPLPAAFDRRFGDRDPADVVAAAPGDDPRTATRVDLPDGERDPFERGRLRAYRAVRSDVVSALVDRSEAVVAGVWVHDALERLVGARDGPTDRSPRAVVGSFVEWVEDAYGAEAADRVRAAFTEVHVVRLRAVPPESDLHAALDRWLRERRPDAYRRPDLTVER